ncbi:MAG: hydrogenase iron-sulfur subunit [Candidatus Thorarchaeota archaeon]
MNYNLLIISTPGNKIKENFAALLKKCKEDASITIAREENLDDLDISEVLKHFYEGFDGIFIITQDKKIEGIIKSEYSKFQKVVNEANRVLLKRGLTKERVKIFNWDGKSYEKLNNFIASSFKNLIKFGPSPVKVEKLMV